MIMNKRKIALVFGCCLMALAYSSCKKEAPAPTGGGTAPCTKKNWYEDKDGDGKGNPDVTLFQCDQPAGYVEDNTDKVDLPVNRTAVPIVFKITGETCYYCGAWGWQAWIDLADAYPNGAALVWANYGVGFSDAEFRNQEINPTMEPIENMFEDGGGKPNFATNGVDYSTNDGSAKSAADAFIQTTPDVAAVMKSNLEGDKLTVNTDVKFFADLSGDYYVGAYVIENKAVGDQAGPAGANGPVEHHYVMRGSMTTSAWGVKLTSSAKEGDLFTQEFEATIPSNYKKENLSYGIIIWKKVGTKYEFVNAYSAQ